jgi:hypothetical protein
MNYTWVDSVLIVDGKPRAYVVLVREENAHGKEPQYQARLVSTGEGSLCATLEEAKAWCEEPFKLAEVEDALDGKQRCRNAPQYLPVFLSASWMVANGSRRVRGASSSGTAP